MVIEGCLELSQKAPKLIFYRGFSFCFEGVYAATGSAGEECVHLCGNWRREPRLQGIHNDLHRLLRVVLADSGFLYNNVN